MQNVLIIVQIAVVRIISAVNYALEPTLEDIREEIVAMKNDINILRESQCYYTCGSTGGWRRAVYLDMTDPKTDCPSAWKPKGLSNRTCGRTSGESNSCDSAFFPVSGGPYSQVCGRIRAYQVGVPDSFRNGRAAIDDAYFSGMAVMHGNPRQHIWTFASGAWENGTSFRASNCPCDAASGLSVPSFVRQDYFCESGYISPGYWDELSALKIHSDPLWDGKGCHPSSTCCSLHNPPYFTKTLNETSTDDLELRLCLNDVLDDILVELVELYIK